MLVLGAFCLGAILLVVYHPAISIGFYADDYEFLVPAGRLSWPEYLISYFDPRLQWHWYRPLQGMQWRMVYSLFGSGPEAFHWLQVLLHLFNSLGLYLLVARVSKRWPLAFAAGLIYVTLPAYDWAVLWPAVADPLVGCFFLVTLWWWLDYVETGSRARYVLALLALIAALLSKETAAVLPAVMFLADRWLVPQPRSPSQLVKRYAPLGVIMGVYALFQIRVLTKGVFTSYLGYGVGGQILTNALIHLSRLTFPWGWESPLAYIWLLVVLAGLAVVIHRRGMRLLFVGAAALLTLLPILPFPAGIALAPRYLYIPFMGSAIGVGLASVGVIEFLRRRQVWWAGVTLSAALVAVAVLGAGAIAEDAQNLAGFSREARVAFRPIFQRHSTPPPDTVFYFFDWWYENLEGIFFARYGSNVSVDGAVNGYVANLAAHRASWIVYRDDRQNWQEQAVVQTSARGAPDLPARFSDSISLEGFELANDHVRAGDVLALILYWRAGAPISKNYTVFAHLLDANGQLVLGADSQPRRGTAPTSSWHPDNLMPDGMIIPVEATVPPGEYKLGIGLYDLETMQGLVLVGADGQRAADQFIIEPIYIDP